MSVRNSAERYELWVLQSEVAIDVRLFVTTEGISMNMSVRAEPRVWTHTTDLDAYVAQFVAQIYVHAQ